ncbi:MAG: minor capsid protein [Lachnospiraceae bacterium]|jgi:hypothetical protein|nr:minor capsid protein [Lachnospiraceae bacterium]
MNDYDIGEAFEAIEDRLIKSMMRNMARHRVEEIAEEKEWSMWQAEQLKAMEKYKKANQKAYQKEFNDINDSISEAITQARQIGNMRQEIKILEAIKNGFKPTQSISKKASTTAEFFRLNDRKLEALIKATKDDFQKAEVAMLRMANDQYRKIIFNAQAYANTGSATYEQAVDMASKDFLSSGINCIEYKNGTRVNISSYARMALQTASKRAYFTGEGEKRQEWGITTVIMNKRGAACPKCLPFVGKVFIDDVWSGGKASDGPYPLLSVAIAKGLYHPNCKDSHTTYFEGITTTPKAMSQVDINRLSDKYRDEQKQKYAERMVQRYKNLKEVSLDPDDIQKYDKKFNEWKNKLKGIDKSDNNAIIKAKRDGAGRAADYEKYWQSVSLNEAMKKFLAKPKASDVNSKGKIIYSSPETPIRIVYDVNGKYFRIQDMSMDVKKNYLDINGNAAFNITENGKTRGRTKSEFQAATHFKNNDKG